MRWVWALLAVMVAGCASVRPAPGLERCVWVSRFEYSTRADIERIVRGCADAGVTAVMFQVRGNGTVYYHSGHELWSERFGFKAPGFDPLAVAIEVARQRGIELHAWINVVPGWRGDVAKADPAQLVRSRPAWFVSDAGGPIALESGYYWLDVANPSVRAYLAEVCSEIVRNYSVDGLHLDHVRCADGNADARNTTELVRYIHREVRRASPRVQLSAAVWPDAADARRRVGQDWKVWADEALVDVFFPMNYTDDDALFSLRTQQALRAAGRVPVIVGVGAYKHESERQSARQSRHAVAAGARGVCLFSYGSVMGRGEESFRRVVEAAQ